jgi:hypothetical protein
VNAKENAFPLAPQNAPDIESDQEVVDFEDGSRPQKDDEAEDKEDGGCTPEHRGFRAPALRH